MHLYLPIACLGSHHAGVDNIIAAFEMPLDLTKAEDFNPQKRLPAHVLCYGDVVGFVSTLIRRLQITNTFLSQKSQLPPASTQPTLSELLSHLTALHLTAVLAMHARTMQAHSRPPNRVVFHMTHACLGSRLTNTCITIVHDRTTFQQSPQIASAAATSPSQQSPEKSAKTLTYINVRNEI